MAASERVQRILSDIRELTDEERAQLETELLAMEEQMIERAREITRQQRTSLNALSCDHIELLSDQATGDELLEEFQALWAEVDQSPGGSSRDGSSME